ncbi:putative glycerol-3-phosphate dehydrogenase [Wallemia mellicola]|nr:putative glycerol-3-phosphate dehydrogenase [Wallemia mellicola]TIC49911.1 putative glycerol-3-phosphate dehydrogenase [Wallemia mellicola]
MFRRASSRLLSRNGLIGSTAAFGLSSYAYLNAQKESISMDDSVDRRPSALWTPPTRDQMLAKLGATNSAEKEELWDLLIVGGGATGAGVAVDAATRGYKTALVERDDFSSGTSSKSTKLVHGGVRYLQKAILELDYEQWKLVREALHERKTFLDIAPYLSQPLPIMLPVYTWWQLPYFFIGCKVYDFLAGSQNMESSYAMFKGKTVESFPMLKSDGLVGSVVYYDGQHNDARMNMALIMTAVHHGATVANHTEVVSLSKDANGKIEGARLRDNIHKTEWDVKAKGIINATGPFSDGIRKFDEPQTQEIVAPSSGVHITLPSYYCSPELGLIDPNTSDGRVIFFLPWLGNVIAGTTDSPSKVERNPAPKEEEIQWIIDEVRRYLSPDLKVRRGDVLSAWSGLRPLVRDPAAKNTQSLVRNHMINISKAGLLTIAGGKWTTYRAMAEETVDAAIKEFGLEPRKCQTTKVKLVGSHGWTPMMFIKLIQQFGLETDVAKHLSATYGSLAWNVAAMTEATGLRWPIHGTRLATTYPFLESEVRYACRSEYAQTSTDVIARRTRLSFLNAQASLEALPRVVDIMAEELGWDLSRKQQEFDEGKEYLMTMGLPPTKQNLSLGDVRSGKVVDRESKEIEDAVFARAQFSPSELETLKDKFAALDVDHDGSITREDLGKSLHNLGYENVSEQAITDVLRDTQHRDGVNFTEFLDLASGLKEVSLSNAFTSIISQVPASLQEHVAQTHLGGPEGPNPVGRGAAADANSPAAASGGGV